MKERNFELYVIAIADEYTVLVKGGREYNSETLYPLKVGDKLRIIIPGDELKDPFSEESLGYYDVTKSIVQINRVFDKYFECVKKTRSSSLSVALSPMINGETVLKELKVDSANVLYPTDTTDLTIKVGDPVVEY